jgi:hypothetical protein
MPTETRYFRNATHTVNGLTAYQLGTSNTATGTSVSVENAYTFMGIRVWKRSADGVETEITSGRCVALVTTGTLGASPAVRSTIWNCPQTSLNPTDAIVIRVYSVDSDGETGQVLMATFITEQLGASSLDAATWTVYYYNNRTLVDETQFIAFYFGSSTRPSRITGFTWTPYVPPPVGVPRWLGDGLAGAALIGLLRRLPKVSRYPSKASSTFQFKPYPSKVFKLSRAAWALADSEKSIKGVMAKAINK